MIQELYEASLAGVPIVLNIRGLCCLRAGVQGLSPTIQVYSVLGRFLEHSRIYRFENGGAPEFFIGSADLMTRNLSRRMEAVAPVCDPAIKAELENILRTYDEDNCLAWDMQPDGEYVRRHPAEGEARRSAQQVLIERSASP
jgi:polyphosphate kinase